MNNIKTWLGGMISAAAGGLSAAFGGVVIDPEHFTKPKNFAMLAAIAAIVPVLAYLKQSPLPGLEPEPKNPPTPPAN